MFRKLFILIGIFASPNFVLAHAEDAVSWTEQIRKTSISLVTLGGALIILLVIVAVAREKREVVPAQGAPELPDSTGETIFKIAVFSLLAIISLGVTFYLSASTIYLNIKSESGGPVHWHADFRIFNCGEEVFLKEPSGLSNKIGKTDLHEHGDGRIHVEGVAVRFADMSLHEFFEAIGGSLTTGELAFPGRAGNDQWMVNGQRCEDTGEAAYLQVFLYKTEGDTIRQSKLENFPEYVLSGHSQVPPGDCIIFEYSPEIKNRTDKICNFTDIAIRQGDYKYTE